MSSDLWCANDSLLWEIDSPLPSTCLCMYTHIYVYTCLSYFVFISYLLSRYSSATSDAYLIKFWATAFFLKKKSTNS